MYYERFECTTIKKGTGFISFFSITWTVKLGTLKYFHYL